VKDFWSLLSTDHQLYSRCVANDVATTKYHRFTLGTDDLRRLPYLATRLE